MQIFIKTLTGKTIELNVNLIDTINHIKQQIHEKDGIPPDQQRLIHGGKQIVNDKTINYYNIQPGATLHIILALR